MTVHGCTSVTDMATNKKPVKKAAAKKAPANNKKAAANKKAAPKKKPTFAPSSALTDTKDANVSAVGVTSTPKDNAPSVVVYANDVKNKSLRDRILAWFRR